MRRNILEAITLPGRQGTLKGQFCPGTGLDELWSNLRSHQDLVTNDWLLPGPSLPFLGPTQMLGCPPGVR